VNPFSSFFLPPSCRVLRLMEFAKVHSPLFILSAIPRLIFYWNLSLNQTIL
jgi:hypothetical protein